MVKKQKKQKTDNKIKQKIDNIWETLSWSEQERFGDIYADDGFHMSEREQLQLMVDIKKQDN